MMVIELLGENLEDLMKSMNGRRFTLPTVLNIADQLVIKVSLEMIKIDTLSGEPTLEGLHSSRFEAREFLHRIGELEISYGVLD